MLISYISGKSPCLNVQQVKSVFLGQSSTSLLDSCSPYPFFSWTLWVQYGIPRTWPCWSPLWRTNQILNKFHHFWPCCSASRHFLVIFIMLFLVISTSISSPLRTVEAPRLIDIDPLHGVHRHHAGHELLCLLTAGRSASLGQANRL